MNASYGDVYRLACEELKRADIEDAKTDAFYLLEHVTGFSRSELLLKNDENISTEEYDYFKGLIERRISHEPCQYIIGKAWFMGLEFKVDDSVLIPRQDTEVLTEKAIEIIGAKCMTKILDLCTGSGAIAVSIKHFCPECVVDATDISRKALDIARYNAKLNDAEIDFFESDLFSDVKRKYDMIISNPPYIADTEYENLMPEVKDYEPENALRAGSKGLDHYRVIAGEASEYLNENGMLVLEIGHDQADDVTSLLSGNGFKNIKIIKDLSGLDRVVLADMDAGE